MGNGLLIPSSGRVLADGLDSKHNETLWELRQKVGLVSQDPDEQIVSSTVIDEVAFGPENLGIDPVEIAARVAASLEAVGLSDYAEYDPNNLSGGQKQRLVLAGILAMQPRYLILDEPTSMLDRQAVSDFTNIIEYLRMTGHGILHITHDLDLAACADEAIVLSNGKMVYRGDPESLLADKQSLLEWQLEVPLPEMPRQEARLATGATTADTDETLEAGQTLELSQVYFSYASFNSQPVSVLNGLSLALLPGSYTLISGVSGAGKSTLLRLATGLLKPNEGEIGFVSSATGETVYDPITPGQVGLVFQHPEDQLFAATVAEDIAFGPQNLGLLPSKNKADKHASEQAQNQLDELVTWALQSVGLNAELFAERSPFLLSGGEMRRVALAGVLAMQPRWLLFDEPTAGLDASGRAFMHQLINDQLAKNTAVLVVSHSVDEFASRCQQHYRLEGGQLWPM
jgi:energy-coupling factor transport system ATP-binding protein